MLECIKYNDFKMQERLVLSAKISGTTHSYAAINDFVVQNETSFRVTSLSLFIDDQHVSDYKSDGIIISTPTGSTAYSLSAGGPILYPELNAFVITSLNPLSLSARPLIVRSNSEVRVTLSKQESQLKSLLIFDGNQEVSIQNDNNEFVVKKSEKKFRLVHPQDHDFFNVCRNKLSWSLSRDET